MLNDVFVLSEYEVVSTTKGPNGQEVSILTTNQTHTAVENLKPESRYETPAVGCIHSLNRLGISFRFDRVSSKTMSALTN